MTARVAIVMGSASDTPVMQKAAEMLERFGVAYELRVLSAHRTPDALREWARGLESRGVKVVIAGAGGAAHLAGTVAALTLLPTIGVPLATSSLGGVDALLSTVQMPRGVPVATVAIGEAGAANAAILAVQMLAIADDGLRARLAEEREAMRRQLDPAPTRPPSPGLPRSRLVSSSPEPAAAGEGESSGAGSPAAGEDHDAASGRSPRSAGEAPS